MLETLGNLGDFGGGIAVIATLTYLAHQLRHTTRTVQSNSVRERTDGLLNAVESLNDPMNASLYLKAGRDFSGLTPEERARFGLIHGLFLARLNTALEYRERDLIDDETLEFYLSVVRMLVDNPGAREWRATCPQFEVVPARVRAWLEENLD